jgi:hypothetical protein
VPNPIPAVRSPGSAPERRLDDEFAVTLPGALAFGLLGGDRGFGAGLGRGAERTGGAFPLLGILPNWEKYILLREYIMADESSPTLPTPGGSNDLKSFKVANVPKVTYQDPQSISTNYGWGMPVDFVLPKTIGKVLDMVLQIDVTVTGEVDTFLPPTPYWFERLETSLGGSAPIETVNKDENFLESLMFLDVQDFQTIAPMVNINSNGSFKTSGSTNAIKTGRYFLPLWANCLMTAQPYLRGFNSEWKLRFVLSNLQPTLLPAPGSNPNAVAITGLRLLITEAQLPPNIEQRIAYKHSKGIVYDTINRVRHIDTKAISSGDNEFTLTTFGNESAGLVCYIRAADNSTDYSKLGVRGKASFINLRDAQGNAYYATNLDTDFNLYFYAPWTTTREPLADNTCTNNYTLPFSANLSAVLADGRDLGAYALSGKEKAVLTLSAADVTANASALGSTQVFVAVSYDYLRIKVKGGNARVSYNR